MTAVVQSASGSASAESVVLVAWWFDIDVIRSRLGQSDLLQVGGRCVGCCCHRMAQLGVLAELNGDL